MRAHGRHPISPLPAPLYPPGQSFDEFGTFHRLSEGEQHRIAVRGLGDCRGCSCGEETAGEAAPTTCGCSCSEETACKITSTSSRIGDRTGTVDVNGCDVRPLVVSSTSASSLSEGLGGGSNGGLLSDWLEVCKVPSGCDNSSGSDLLSIRPVRSRHSELCFGLVVYIKGRAVLGWTVRGGYSLLGEGSAGLENGACRNYYSLSNARLSLQDKEYR